MMTTGGSRMDRAAILLKAIRQFYERMAKSGKGRTNERGHFGLTMGVGYVRLRVPRDAMHVFCISTS